MQALRKMSKTQPHLPWLIGSVVVSLFILIAIVAVVMGEGPQIAPPVLHSSDWVLAIGMGLAIPATILTYWALQFLPQPKPRLQVQEESLQRPIIFKTPHAKPEVVLRLTQERDEWQRKYQELLRVRPEPERELTYSAVTELLKAGNIGIKAAIEVVRANGGMVGRRGYDELKELLPLLSPTAQEPPGSRDPLTVNREPESVNQRVNRKARLPRKRRGW